MYLHTPIIQKNVGQKSMGETCSLYLHTRLFHLKVLNFDFKPIFQITLFIEPKLCVVMNLFKKTEQLVLVYIVHMYLFMYSQNGRNNIKSVDFLKKGFACFQIQFMQKSRHRSKQQPDNSFFRNVFLDFTDHWIFRKSSTYYTWYI